MQSNPALPVRTERKTGSQTVEMHTSKLRSLEDYSANYLGRDKSEV